MEMLACAPDGRKLQNEQDAVDLIGEAYQQGAAIVMIPTDRLEDDFFRLETRVAGQILQKFVTYRIRVAIVGDISQHVSKSSALRDFVYESNRGDHIWFVNSPEELRQRLENN
jgi:hypothetical protein